MTPVAGLHEKWRAKSRRCLVAAWLLIPIVGALASIACAEPPMIANGGEISRISLSELAARADIVALAQVKDTDYVYARSFPNEGSAFLKILIAYKLNQPAEEIIEVYEKGLHPYECYFENPTVQEEGRRYLVFLKLDPGNPERYRGFGQGCALEVLVTRENRYALKYPVNGIALEDSFDELVRKLEFRDNYALISEESLSPDTRNDLLASGLIIPYSGKYKFTHGVDLTDARNLVAPASFEPRRGR